MGFWDLILSIIVLGVIFWLVDRFLPMHAAFKAIVRVIAVLVLIFLLLAFVGVFGTVPSPFHIAK